jgi:hypothetical protein
MLLIAGGGAIAILLLALTIAMVLIFSLRSDVAVLEDQARKSAKATKALQEEVADLQDALAAEAKRREAAKKAATAAMTTNIDAANPATDCVIRPGSKGGLDCIDRINPKN